MNLPGAIGLVEKNSLSYVQAAFDALSAGKVVVPLRSADDADRLQYLQQGNIVEPEQNSGWFEQTLSVADSTDIAHISFTSGTEGPPKGVMISRLALNDTVRRLQSVMQMDQSVREYIGVPVYHSFGYGRCRHVASVGGSFYIPAQGFNPVELSVMLKDGSVNALSVVPSLLRLLLNQPELLGEERLSLKWLEIGSQSMSVEEKQAVKKLFPNAVIVQHYGLTEASRTTLLQIHPETDAMLDSVGKVVGDGEIEINERGCICIKGSHLASEIIKEGQCLPVANASGWFETSDLGVIKESCLYFLGRADNVVNCGGQKLSTEKYEARVRSELRADSDFTISRVPDNNYGEGFLVSYVAASLLSNLDQVARSVLADLGINAKSAVHFNHVDEIPKTHTGKIQHKKLVEQYHLKTKNINSNGGTDAVSDSDSQLDVQALFSEVLSIPYQQLVEEDSVSSIGIDSLQSVQLSIRLEKLFGYLPAEWRELSLRQWTALPRQPKSVDDQNGEPELISSSTKARPLWDGSSNMNPANIDFWALIKEDFQTHDKDFFSQGLFALFVHRFGNWRMGIQTKILRFPMTLLYRFMRKLTQVFCGIKLDYTVHVGRRVKLEHFGGMIIGARSIGDDTIIRQNTTMGIRDISDLCAKPTIEQGVNIGAGAVIVGDITVGRYSVIGPNCVVTEDLPPFSVVSVGAQIVHSSQE